MKKVDWDKANILGEMYKTCDTAIYISRGATFEESIKSDCWSFRYERHPDGFICGEGIDYDIAAGGFSLNVLFLEEDDEDGNMAHIDFDVGVDL